MRSVKHKKPFVSICIATYNQENYIKDCILSVIAQQHDVDLEILVGDDCSTDQTRAVVQSIADEHPTSVKAIFHKTNLGGSNNYRCLIEHAKGDYIAHLDGDDYWLPGKLAAQVAFLEEHPECSGVYANAVVIGIDGTFVGIFNNSQPIIQDLSYLMQGGNYLNHSSIMYRGALKDEILSIKNAFLDYMVHCRLAMKGPLGYINQLLVVYRTGVATSALLNLSETVREKLWHAILEVGRERVSAKAWKGAIQRFMAIIYWSGFRNRQPSYVTNWSRRVACDLEIPSGKILWMGLGGFLKLVAGRVYLDIIQRLGRYHAKIMSWR